MHIHRWSKWVDVETQAQGSTDMLWGSRYSYAFRAQERRCVKCNRVEIRTPRG